MESEKTIQERVQEAIESGKIKMRPRWHFILKAVLFALGVFITTGLVLYMSSFILFILRQNGLLFVPEFGPKGWYAFFVSLPWLLVGLVMLFVVVLEILVRRYAFLYRKPFIISALGVLVLVFIGAKTIEATSLHMQIMNFSERKMPIGKMWYHSFDEDDFSAVLPGRIVTSTQNGFVVISRRGGLVRVVTNDETQKPFETIFTPGMRVVIFGERTSSSIKAIGIKIISE